MQDKGKKYFKFKETVVLWGTIYEKGLELEVRENGGIYDDHDGSWLFDCDSTNALKYGNIVYR